MRCRDWLITVAATLAITACGGDGNGGGNDGGVDAPMNVIDGGGGGDGGNCTPNGSSCSGGGCCAGSACVNNTCQSVCTQLGDSCSTSAECCAGAKCDVPAGGGGTVCVPGGCSGDGDNCGQHSDCCSLNCSGGTCTAGDPCGVVGDNCSGDGDCCSNNCNGTTCQGGVANCDPIGEACTDGNGCCSDFCANSSGAACGSGDSGCRCALVTNCRPQGELCTDDNQCCNNYCDKPGGVTIGNCASLGSCSVVGEPCGNPGVNGSCCSNACVDQGAGVATCDFLGGCLPINEICTADNQCCSGSCVANGTTSDGRPMMRCDDAFSCLSPGEVCFTGASANCCPNGGGDTGCEPATSGVHRCFGGSTDCVVAGNTCDPTGDAGANGDCCTDIPNVSCNPAEGGGFKCCIPDGQGCSFGDLCCNGTCAPDQNGNLVCIDCVATGNACTADADCCNGCCQDDGSGNMVCAPDTECGGCTLGQLGESCSDVMPCCPGLNCVGVEFPTCQL